MNPNGKPNKLIDEKSPYLLQHAYNPVNWYPWGEEAFTKAKDEDKPIFLSIGYSTCHWCHVMERESFEDEEVAEYLNKNYISIKVDREERSDIDSIYMTYCQMVTGHGGWPLSVFLTSEKKPFYAGTYFPKNRKYGVKGFLEILSSIKEQWENNKEILLSSSDRSVEALQKAERYDKEDIKEENIDQAVEYFKESFDGRYGGFGNAPKFPSPHQLMFLMRYNHLYKDEESLRIVEKTLEGMYKGGLFDHVGFGFSRYSTDKMWLVPHFEKMLYDNALLMISYAEAYQITKKDQYKKIVESIATYIIRDMTDEEGGFYSAEDADSEGVEGKYYVWSKEEIEEMLGPVDSKIYINYYNITKEGNFEGSNIPNLIGNDMNEFEADKGLASRLCEMNRILFMHREKRIRPHKDDKILTSWNGLMIAAMAIAGRALNDDELIKKAEHAVKFIEEKLMNDDKTLYTRYRDGEAKFNALSESYSNIIWGLMELYDSTSNINYLNMAKDFIDKMIELFWDEQEGGFFIYGSDNEEMITRPKEVYDGAMPSGNSVGCYVLLRLARFLDDKMYEEKAEQLLKAFGSGLNSIPHAHTFLLIAQMYKEIPTSRYIISSSNCDSECESMKQVINNEYTPFGIVLINNSETIREQISYLKDYEEKDNKTTGYVCAGFSCQRPVHTAKEFEELIKNS